MVVYTQTQPLIADGDVTSRITVRDAINLAPGVIGTLSDFSSGPISVRIETINYQTGELLVSVNNVFVDLSNYTVLNGASLFVATQFAPPGYVPPNAGYVLPIASAVTLGGIKVGTGLSIDVNGVLTYPLPIASAGTLGGIKVGSGLAIDVGGVLSNTYTYALPIASAGTLGGIRVGSGLTIDVDGVLSGGVEAPYTLQGVGDTVPFTTNAIAGQTANLQEWQVDGVMKAHVDNEGGLHSHYTGSTQVVTNLVYMSQSFASTWLRGGPWWKPTSIGNSVPTITDNVYVAPDGTTTASEIIMPPISGGVSVLGNGPQHVAQWYYEYMYLTPGETYTFSCYMRSLAGPITDACDMLMNSPTWQWGYAARTRIHLTTTWTRYTLTFVANPGDSRHAVGFGYDSAISGTPIAGGTFAIWGAQLETGSSANHYVETVINAERWSPAISEDMINGVSHFKVTAGGTTSLHATSADQPLFVLDGHVSQTGNLMDWGVNGTLIGSIDSNGVLFPNTVGPLLAQVGQPLILRGNAPNGAYSQGVILGSNGPLYAFSKLVAIKNDTTEVAVFDQNGDLTLGWNGLGQFVGGSIRVGLVAGGSGLTLDGGNGNLICSSNYGVVIRGNYGVIVDPAISFTASNIERARVSPYGSFIINSPALSVLTTTYAATLAVRPYLDNAAVYKIGVTDGNAFTISNPIYSYEFSVGQLITFWILNQSAGALGVLTWGDVYGMAPWTQPASGYGRMITFLHSGNGYWTEWYRSNTDIPNPP